MYSLNEMQIEKIHNVIRIHGVVTEDLQLNLLDHICCILEEEYNENEHFDAYLSEVLKRFYKTELREIEEETQLLLTFKHYYAMKKIMFFSGITSTLGILIGALLKFLHLPGAAILLVLGIAIFTVVFLPIMFTLKFRESKHRRERSILMLAVPMCLLIVTGVLFKVMHWPGANVMTQGSMFFTIFVFIPIYLITGLRNADSKVNTLTTSILMLAGAGLTMSMLTVMKSKAVIQKEIRTIERSDYGIHQRTDFSRTQLEGLKIESEDRQQFLNETLKMVDRIETEKQQLLANSGSNELHDETKKSLPYYREVYPNIEKDVRNYQKRFSGLLAGKGIPELEIDLSISPGSSLLNAYQNLCDLQRDLLDYFQFVATAE
ncbi:MAG: sulfite exporter TauE/SafE family protein [Flavobacteriales bacterium]